MSTATAASQNNSNNKVTKGGPFPLAGVLTRIFAFTCENPHQAVNVLGLVCKYWRDCELHFAHGMWKNLTEIRYGKKIRAVDFSHYSFMRRALHTIGGVGAQKFVTHTNKLTQENVASHTAANKDELNEVEMCEYQFKFKCPLLAQNFAVTEEVTPGGLAVLHCGVCEKNVYPVSTMEEIGKWSKEGRCILVSKEVGSRLETANGWQLNKNSIKPFNVALVTTATPSFTKEGGIFVEGDAEQFLRLLHLKVETADEGCSSLLSSDSLLMKTGNSSMTHVHLRLVRVPKYGESEGTGKKIHSNPCMPGGVLCREKMPSANGWNEIWTLDQFCDAWMNPKHIPTVEECEKADPEHSNAATPVRALVAAGKVFRRKEEEEQAQASAGGGKNKRENRANAKLQTVESYAKRMFVRHLADKIHKDSSSSSDWSWPSNG